MGVGNRRIGFSTSGAGVRTGGGGSMCASSSRIGGHAPRAPRPPAGGHRPRPFRAERPFGRFVERARELHHAAEATLGLLRERPVEDGLQRAGVPARRQEQ